MLARPTDHSPAAMIGGVERHPISVLVVDDLPSFRRAAASMIALTDGFRLAGEAASGEEAIAFLEQHRVGLVLIDVNMPGMGGMEAARHIRHQFPDVKVVLLSVYTAESLFRDAWSIGAVFCPKERFGPDDLEALWNDGGRAQA
jgi:two-component system, NarL family, invasion response regulator UvrY